MPDRDRTIVDADAHYVESFDDLLDYFDDADPWRRKFEAGAGGESGREPDVRISFWPTLSRADRYTFPSVRRRDIDFGTQDGVLELKDELGFAKVVLLSQQMLLFGMLEEDKRQTKFAEAYTRYMLDRMVDPAEGVYMTLPVPFNNPRKAAELIEEYGDESGVVGACFITSQVEPPFGHRRYDPIYDAAEAAGLPLLFHGASATVDNFYLSGFSSLIETHTLGFLWDNSATLASLVTQGVPEKFPDLDIVFQETGIFWVPTMMYRMDMEYLRQAEDAPLLERRPSEYMKEFYYGTQPLEVPPDPRYFEYVIEMLGGPDRLLYASDYPHDDWDDPSVIEEWTFLTDDERAGILGGNAEAVFGI